MLNKHDTKIFSYWISIQQLKVRVFKKRSIQFELDYDRHITIPINTPTDSINYKLSPD